MPWMLALNLIVFFGDLDPANIGDETGVYLEMIFYGALVGLEHAKQRYGDKILGIYYYDEPGWKMAGLPKLEHVY